MKGTAKTSKRKTRMTDQYFLYFFSFRRFSEFFSLSFQVLGYQVLGMIDVDHAHNIKVSLVCIPSNAHSHLFVSFTRLCDLIFKKNPRTSLPQKLRFMDHVFHFVQWWIMVWPSTDHGSYVLSYTNASAVPANATSTALSHKKAAEDMRIGPEILCCLCHTQKCFLFLCFSSDWQNASSSSLTDDFIPDDQNEAKHESDRTQANLTTPAGICQSICGPMCHLATNLAVGQHCISSLVKLKRTGRVPAAQVKATSTVQVFPSTTSKCQNGPQTQSLDQANWNVRNTTNRRKVVLPTLVYKLLLQPVPQNRKNYFTSPPHFQD